MSSTQPPLFGAAAASRRFPRLAAERVGQRAVVACERFAAEEPASLAAPTAYDARGFPIPQRPRAYRERIDRLLGRLYPRS